MMPMLRIFGLSLPVAPSFILLAYVIGSEVGTRAMARSAPPDQRAAWGSWFSRATLWAAVAGLIAARLGYALQNLSLYTESPYLLLSIRPGAFSLLPGILVGVALLVWYLRCKQVPYPHIGDALAITAVTVQIILSLRDFLTGEAYGLPTSLPWAINLWQELRHPVQLYEMGLALLVLGVLWVYQRRMPPGATFWRFLALFGVTKLLVEAFRADALTICPGFRIAQIEAFATLMIGLLVLSFYARMRTNDIAPLKETPIHEITTGG